jgi:protoporphyrinogen oxidase
MWQEHPMDGVGLKSETQACEAAVIGAGPAGLTAAYLLAKAGLSVRVIEADPVRVGGIARTEHYKGYRFDIGGHRFFSKSREVEDLWTELLPHDMLERPRSSRIYYGGKLFSYPLKAGETLSKLGLVESIACILSYARARMAPVREPKNLEEWVTNQFGRRLFEKFFKTYTEKVWGVTCREISADWAAQRIKGLSLASAVKSALLPRRNRGPRVIKTLISAFRYPRRGPGMLWEACAQKIKDFGGEVSNGRTVTRCEFDERTSLWGITDVDAEGRPHTTTARHLVSSAPLRELTRFIVPPLSNASLEAASGLKYRDFVTVVLIMKDRQLFADNWIYIHDPAVKVGRIQNFKSWSPEMVPDPEMSCYGLEYFCQEGDSFWRTADADLIALGSREFEAIGLANASDVLDGCVIRQAKAYPVYDDGYTERVATVRAEIERRFPSLHLVGRNGMHRYNNQDHAMMTAILCARNILAGRRVYDLWQVNEDAEYHESGERGASSGAL